MASLHRTAEALGKTVQTLLDETTAEELVMWSAYEQTIGFANHRIEAAICISGAYVGGCNQGTAKAKDLVPRFERDARLDDPEVQAANFDAQVAKHNARFNGVR